MVSQSRSARELEIDPKIAYVHFFDQTVQQRDQLVFGKIRLDFEFLGALEKAIDVFLQGVDAMVSRVGDVVNAVAEITGSVEHGDGHPIQLTDRAVIITERFHIRLILSELSIFEDCAQACNEPCGIGHAFVREKSLTRRVCGSFRWSSAAQRQSG